MPSPEENSAPVISPLNGVQENVQRFNDDEAAWRCFARKRARRKRLRRLFRLLELPPITEEQLDQLEFVEQR
jgi:hypothetical protein